MAESVLLTVKKPLGVAEDYTVFDEELVMHINSVFSTLNQLGVGPSEGFSITGDTETWDLFLANDEKLNNAKSYMYLRVRMLFDPPTTSFTIDAFKKQIEELEWRLNVTREFSEYPMPTPEDIADGRFARD